MSGVTWPTRRNGGTARPNVSPWFIRLPTDDLRVLSAVMKLGGGRVPPWAEDLVARLRDKPPATPDPGTPAPAAPNPDHLLRGSDDFAAAMAAAWPRAEPPTRDALRTVAAALGIEAPADPPPEPPAGSAERVQEPDDDPAGDLPTPEPETAPTDAPAAAPEPVPDGRPETVWTKYWDTGAEDDRKTTPIEMANTFSRRRAAREVLYGD